jgi:transcriptional regulator with XRE-family HTH domain
MEQQSATYLMFASSTAKLGAAFRAERKARGLTQAEVAQSAGCRRQTIVDLESGKSVTTQVLFRALNAIGKQLQLTSVRVDLENVRALLGPDWEDE